MSRMEFEATIEPGSRGGALVRLPDSAADHFGTKARFPVRATFNGVEYRGSAMPMGDGAFCVGVTKAVQAEAGVGAGHTVTVTLRRNDEERRVEVPDELAEAVQANPEATRRFAAMPYTHRKEYAEWVGSARKPETRRRRVEKAVTMIVAGSSFS